MRNYPLGLSIDDIPGNSEWETYLSGFIDTHWFNLSMFQDFIDKLESGNQETCQHNRWARTIMVKNDDNGLSSVSPYLMVALLEIEEIKERWDEYMENRADENFHTLRGEECSDE